MRAPSAPAPRQHAGLGHAPHASLRPAAARVSARARTLTRRAGAAQYDKTLEAAAVLLKDPAAYRRALAPAARAAAPGDSAGRALAAEARGAAAAAAPAG